MRQVKKLRKNQWEQCKPEQEEVEDMRENQ